MKKYLLVMVMLLGVVGITFAQPRRHHPVKRHHHRHHRHHHVPPHH